MNHEHIAHLRKRARLTQLSLAAKMGVARATVNRWETGHASPRSGLLASLATALGCSTDDLLTPREVA